MKKAILSVAVFACASLMAADISYELNETPYSWSNLANWSGGALPVEGDSVTVADSLLLVSPLAIQDGTSAVSSNLFLDTGVVCVEEGATLTVRKGNAGGINFAQSKGATGVLTNRGTITAWNFDLGRYDYAKGALARFDNFGTLTVHDRLRMGVSGTPSIFHNHAGAVVNKVGGNEYSFYFGVANGGHTTLINEGDIFDNTENIRMGLVGATAASTELIQNGYGRFFCGRVFSVGDVRNSHGRIILNDNSFMSGAGEYRIGGSSVGKQANARGSIILNDNSVFSASNHVSVGYYVQGTGTLELNDSSVMRQEKGDLRVGYGTACTGTLTLTNEALLVAMTEVQVGCSSNATGRIIVSGSSRFEQEDKGVYVGYAAYSTGIVHVAGGAMLCASNIVLVRSSNRAKGVLEIGEGGVVSNIAHLTVGNDGNTSIAMLKMSGGKILFNGKKSDALYLNNRMYGSLASVRGWGTVAYENPRAVVIDWEESGFPRSGGVVHYGQVVADGEGVERDLDFGKLGSLAYHSTEANPNGANAWLAVNKGRLKLPRCLPIVDENYKCIGDSYRLDYSKTNVSGNSRPSVRIGNSFSCVFTGAEYGNYIFSELYASDRSDIPAGLDSLGADKTLAVWRIGYFSDGPEAAAPVNKVGFTSARLHFRHMADDLDGIAMTCVYRHDGTADGKWRLVGRTETQADWPVASANVSSPSAADWNLGWFAIIGRERPFGTSLIIR